jgi:hypothetical protein
MQAEFYRVEIEKEQYRAIERENGLGENGARAVDVNHIIARGMGGVKDNRLDIIENLMATCREHHTKYGDSPKWFDYLVKVHAAKLNMAIEIITEKLNSL